MSDSFLGCDCSYDESEIVIFGAPFDGTASYRPGARFAPSAIRAESYAIETYSPYCDGDLTELSVCDFGDLELPFGNAEKVIRIIERQAKKFFSDGKKPLLLGGEHLVTLGAVKSAFEKFPDLCIIHFDAHTDLRDEYLGERLSHATVIRRCHDFLGDNRIFQFGIRSGERHEFEFAKTHMFINKFNLDRLNDAITEIGSRPVYLTVDLDVLDPSELPGTGTPEAGGVRFGDLVASLEKMRALNIVAADICELAPNIDTSGISTALACKLLREMLMIL